MNIVFTDDEIPRHDLAEEILGSHHTLFHAYNANEAIAIIEILTKSGEVIGLYMTDHDMPYSKNGSELASDIINGISNVEKFIAQVIVHSFNPDGAKNIEAKFRAANIPVTRWMFSEDMLKQLQKELEPQ